MAPPLEGPRARLQHCKTDSVAAPPAPPNIEVSPVEMAPRIVGIVIIVAVRIVAVVAVRTAPPSAAVDHLRTGWGCHAEHSCGSQNDSDFFQHHSLLFLSDCRL